MSKQNFFKQLSNEIDRIASAKISKRPEHIIDKVVTPTRVQINQKEYLQFNSNDYLGLRFHSNLIQAEHQASLLYGTSPGAVRFISGTLAVFIELEKALATFHSREAAMIGSSAFAINVGVLHALLKPQSKDSLIDPNVLVLSDALNHRSIIDGIRVANLPASQRLTYPHLDVQSLSEQLELQKDNFSRAIVLTDGIFSMLGEVAPLAELRAIVDKYDHLYPQGVLLVVDDSHGVGVHGSNGRGVEETEGVQADVLIGTLGKAFGSDGGYVVASQLVIDYLRESTATYIYSNSICPGSAAAALAGVELSMSPEGRNLRTHLSALIKEIKTAISRTPYSFAIDSSHPIQPLLIGDSQTAAKLTATLYDRQILVTNISYPIVPKGRDELRIQLNAHHTSSDLEVLLNAFIA